MSPLIPAGEPVFGCGINLSAERGGLPMTVRRRPVAVRLRQRRLCAWTGWVSAYRQPFRSSYLEPLFNCPVPAAVVGSFHAGSFQIFDEAAIRADFGVTILVADKGRGKEDRVAAWAPVL